MEDLPTRRTVNISQRLPLRKYLLEAISRVRGARLIRRQSPQIEENVWTKASPTSVVQ